jgi:uncharacterized membrane protein YcaP (DUF421 family)
MCHETITHMCLPASEKILRTVAVYGFLVIGLRLAGKRELGQFNGFDLVVLITIANAVQNAIIGPENSLTGGLLGAATLLAVNYLVVRLAYRFPMLDRVLEGREVVLYEGGAVNQRACERELITREELMTVARRQGVRSLDEVDRIVLERNGNVSVIVKEDVTLRRILEELRDLRAVVGGR